MGKNKRLISEIRKIWKQQEKLLEANHKEVNRIIKKFPYVYLKEILLGEQLDLHDMEMDLEYSKKQK